MADTPAPEQDDILTDEQIARSDARIVKTIMAILNSGAVLGVLHNLHQPWDSVCVVGLVGLGTYVNWASHAPTTKTEE